MFIPRCHAPRKKKVVCANIQLPGNLPHCAAASVTMDHKIKTEDQLGHFIFFLLFPEVLPREFCLRSLQKNFQSFPPRGEIPRLARSVGDFVTIVALQISQDRFQQKAQTTGDIVFRTTSITGTVVNSNDCSAVYPRLNTFSFLSLIYSCSKGITRIRTIVCDNGYS